MRVLRVSSVSIHLSFVFSARTHAIEPSLVRIIITRARDSKPHHHTAFSLYSRVRKYLDSDSFGNVASVDQHNGFGTERPRRDRRGDFQLVIQHNPSRSGTTSVFARSKVIGRQADKRGFAMTF